GNSMSSASAAARPPRHFHLNLQALAIFIAGAAIFAVFGVLNANFLTVGNLRDIAVSASVNALIGIGLTFVIITGGIDLSVGSIASLVGIVSANMMVNSGVAAFPALLVGLALGFVARVKILVYGLSGLLAALAGLVIVARISAAQSEAGAPYLLTAIASAVIGGANLMGGEGRIAGTLVGALILGALTNGLVLLNVP